MSYTQLTSVSCTSLSETILQKAGQLAKKTGLSFCRRDCCSTPYVLNYTDDCLQLEVNVQFQGKARIKPLYVDFLLGASAYRHEQNRTIHQPLARAVGIKPGLRPDIFDATAGLGHDAFVFASLGCRVIASERSPVIGALLQDGLERASKSQGTIASAANRIHLITGNSAKILEQLSQPVDTVYLDPMYPHTKKSALNKKDMRIIRDIVGDDDDAPLTLEIALHKAADRVVVKRPKGAEYLGNIRPSHETLMKNSRFDVYLTNYL